MSATDGDFAQWLSQAQLAEDRLTAQQRGLLQYAFAFRERCGDDYYSRRLLSHFLLHCDSGLKVAEIARLVGISRPTASHQQGVSSKETIQAAHHRMAGRPHGKLLPRYAGPIAEFILTHADATRYDILDFIERTWGVRVSTVALHHFCKQFGLDRATRAEATGGRRCPSRHAVGGWGRHLSWHEVDAFCRRTCPWGLLHNEDALVSFDEHTIPRWTRKFHIGKGYSTTRNKYMRCEKLFTGYDLVSGRFLNVRGTPGNVNLQELAVPLVEQVLRQGRPRSLHALFDAGAGKSDAGVRAWWGLAEQHPNMDVTLRACRYPHRLRAWKQLPSGLFVSVEDPGVCRGSPPKEVRLAETQTVLKDEEAEQASRTIVCREVRPGPKKDRSHPLYTTSMAEPQEGLQIFRARQNHEQGHRVEVHDLFVDAVPCGYDKESPARKRPPFHPAPFH